MFRMLLKGRRALSRWRLTRRADVHIAADAKVAWERITLRARSVLRIGSGSILECSIACDRDGAEISIGNNTFIGASMLVAAERIEIGDDVLMAWGGTIVDHDSHALTWEQRRNDVRDWYHGRKDWTHVACRSVQIENKAWIGFNVAILKGVRIGEGAVVAACSVVTRDVPPYTLVAGNPARIVRSLERQKRSVEAP